MTTHPPASGSSILQSTTLVRVTRILIFTGMAVAASVLLYNAARENGLGDYLVALTPQQPGKAEPSSQKPAGQQRGTPVQQHKPAPVTATQPAVTSPDAIVTAMRSPLPAVASPTPGSHPMHPLQVAMQNQPGTGPATPTPTGNGQPAAAQPAPAQPAESPAAGELVRLREALKQANAALATYERKHAEYERQRQAANAGPQALQQQVQAAQTAERLASMKMQWYRYWYDTMMNGQIKLPLAEPGGVSLDLIYAPPSPIQGFRMGRTNEERVAANSATNGLLHDNSFPAHTRYMATGFFIGRNEVSNAQYYEYLKSSGADEPTQRQWATLAQQHPEKPAVKVNWQEARNFCQWLGAKHRLNIRLPTEVEWEYVARGPYAPRFAKVQSPSKHKPRTVAQGAEAVAAPTEDFSWLSVQRMSGNVSEWCTDLFEEEAYAKLTKAAAANPALLAYRPVAIPPGWNHALSAGNRRSVRGGAFGESAVNCEAASRRWKTETTRRDFIGFRVVLVPDVPKP